MKIAHMTDQTVLTLRMALEKKMWHLLAMAPVAGDGCQAPGFVTLCHTDPDREIYDPIYQPYVVHFFNAQDGGFHGGHYTSSRKLAFEMFGEKAERYTRHHKETHNTVAA